MKLTPAQLIKAARAADDYYSHDYLGHGRWDAQDAEYAAKQSLTFEGLPDNEETDKLADEIAARVVRAWEDIQEDTTP